MLAFRRYLPGDTLYLIDIESKACEFSLTADEWQQYGQQDGELLLATWSNEPVGFIAWTPDPLGYFIAQVAVKPTYQHRGIGRALLQELAEYAHSQKVGRLLACPDEPDWLMHFGFKESSFNLYYLDI